MQELKEKLENLSIHRKEKQNESLSSVEDPLLSNVSDGTQKESSNKVLEKNLFVNLPSGDSNPTNCSKLIQKPVQDTEKETSPWPRNRLMCYSKSSLAAIAKARKEAENIIRMQSSLSYKFRRTPLPDICRSPKNEEQDKKLSDNDLKKSLREKTAKSFAIVEKKSDSTETTRICPSRSSVVELPSNEEIAIAYPQIPREGISRTLSRSRFRVSRYVFNKDERPKTTPGNIDHRKSLSEVNKEICDFILEPETHKRTSLTFPSLSTDITRTNLNYRVDVLDHVNESRKPESRSQLKKRASSLIKNPSYQNDVLLSSSSGTQKLTPLVVKKRMRCSQCRKKINITNSYTCRCGRLFCAIHRYSEVHNCHFDYKEEGKRILQETNPLIAASKLPKM
ncbi:conserved hypothetical protein [Pediculus humanus corporis]|uniref:AN1-type domain-containing protein n=1 Tax=Pediculus humanus subsp. corporis TaxID=121224 RepID=E0VKS2_PEDHC|nr:uncharacterized protein Phum_PHUM268920 [Pediculus humanus corporis]EEB13978.1 conserved hypothetical protein [Pediculus humanus corporis]